MAVIELVVFKTNSGFTEDQLVAQSNLVTPVLSLMPGFLSRQLCMSDDGRWADVVRWSDIDAAKAAANAVMKDQTCLGFFQMIDQGSMDFMHLTPQGVNTGG